VDVARAVGEDALGAHAHHELRADELALQRVVVGDAREAVHAQAARPLEVDEQQRHRCVHQHVAEAAEHAVAVVAGEGQLVGGRDAHEAGVATLV